MIRQQWTLLRQSWRSGFAAAFARTAWAFAILTAAGFAVTWFAPSIADQALSLFMDMLEQKEIVSDTGVISAAALLRSNISACFLTVCYGCIPFLYLPALTLGANAMLLGIPAARCLQSGYSIAAFLAALLPHGIFEIPALLVTIAVGLELCRDLSGRLRRRKGLAAFPQYLADGSRLFLFPVLPLLAVAALMEAYVTPWAAALFF